MNDAGPRPSGGLTAFLEYLVSSDSPRFNALPCLIEQGLYLGCVAAARNKKALKNHNITHVLVVARSLDAAFPDDFIYKMIDVLDSPYTNLAEHFNDCFDFIDEAKRAGGNVLVHCFAGRSRSATVVIAYLMKTHQISLQEALSLVKSKHSFIRPNDGFMSQLEKFEKSLENEKSTEDDEQTDAQLL